MAEAWAHRRVAFWLLLCPGLFLASTVLSINFLKDGWRISSTRGSPGDVGPRGRRGGPEG